MLEIKNKDRDVYEIAFEPFNGTAMIMKSASGKHVEESNDEEFEAIDFVRVKVLTFDSGRACAKAKPELKRREPDHP